MRSTLNMADFLFIFLLSLYRQSGDLAGTCCLIETKLLSWSVQLDVIAQDIIVTELKIAFFMLLVVKKSRKIADRLKDRYRKKIC